jgi:hypothetical protein
MTELAQQVEPPVSVAQACDALGLSRATLYRQISARSLPATLSRYRTPRLYPRTTPTPRRKTLLPTTTLVGGTVLATG